MSPLFRPNIKREARIVALVPSDFSESFAYMQYLFVYLINNSTNKMVHLGIPTETKKLFPCIQLVMDKIIYNQNPQYPSEFSQYIFSKSL